MFIEKDPKKAVCVVLRGTIFLVVSRPLICILIPWILAGRLVFLKIYLNSLLKFRKVLLLILWSIYWDRILLLR